MPYLGSRNGVDNDDETKKGFPWKSSSEEGIKRDEDTKSKYPYGTHNIIIYIYIYITAKTKLLK